MAENTIVLTEISLSKGSKQAINIECRAVGSHETEVIDEFSHLTPEEAEILRRQLQLSKRKITYLSLFRYAQPLDWILLAISYTCSVLIGAALPLSNVILGRITQLFADLEIDTDQKLVDPSFETSVNRFAIWFVYLGIVISVLTYIETYLHVDRGEVLTGRIRQRYLSAILQKNSAYFDRVGSREITNRILTDTFLIQNGISERSGVAVSGVASFLSSIVIGFYCSWKLTLLIIATITLAASIIFCAAKKAVIREKESVSAYKQGLRISDTAFGTMGLTAALGAEDRIAKSYDKFLKRSMQLAFKRRGIISMSIGLVWMILYATYSLTFWQGSKDIASQRLSVGNLITTISAEMVGVYALSGIWPSVEAMIQAVEAGKRIFEAVNAFPGSNLLLEEDGTDQVEHKTPFNGAITFKNVKLIFPSQPHKVIVDNFNLEIQQGQKVAFIGPSGAGKSAVLGLLERFYEPVKGEILIDGTNIASINTQTLRQNISLVSQDPMLFSGTIYENVAHGLKGNAYASLDEIEREQLVIRACRQSNAWGFILTLKNGINTQIGERGCNLSAGQRQRLAIARAIVSKPSILLLDEATSLLEPKSEAFVQNALQRVSKFRTTIIISNKLSTARQADLIVVMNEGQIREKGTHLQLLDQDGLYASLVRAHKVERRIGSHQSASVGSLWRKDSAQLTSDKELDSYFQRRDSETPFQRRGSDMSSSIPVNDDDELLDWRENNRFKLTEPRTMRLEEIKSRSSIKEQGLESKNELSLTFLTITVSYFVGACALYSNTASQNQL